MVNHGPRRGAWPRHLHSNLRVYYTIDLNGKSVGMVTSCAPILALPETREKQLTTQLLNGTLRGARCLFYPVFPHPQRNGPRCIFLLQRLIDRMLR